MKNTLKKLKNQLTLEVHISEFGDGMITKTIKTETSKHNLFIDIIISKIFLKRTLKCPHPKQKIRVKQKNTGHLSVRLRKFFEIIISMNRLWF